MRFKNCRQQLFLLVIVLTISIKCAISFECGVRKRSINPLIVRGQQTAPGDWPWHTAVYRRGKSFSTKYVCGGTLISELYVLTALHCVMGKNGRVLAPNKILVRLGLHDISTSDSNALQEHNVQSILKYPSNSTVQRNDIALLKLETQVDFTDFVQPACVNQMEDLTHKMGTAVGWGRDETDKLSTELKRATMPVVSGYECAEHNDRVFAQVLDSSLFCAGFANGTNVCNGDSGGGLHFEKNGVWYVGGIISFTAPRNSSNLCHTESFTVFTKIYQFLPWIRNVTELPYLDIQTGTHNLLPTNCGQSLRNRIFFGNNTKVFDYPWMALLRDKSKKIIGAGSIIHQRYVLTSANCEHSVDHVILGEHTISTEIDCNVYKGSAGDEIERDCANPVKQFEVESFLGHPFHRRGVRINNIGLIRLATQIIWDDHIQPICLPVTPELRITRIKHYIFTGWGWTEHGNVSDVLQQAILPLVRDISCQRKFFKENVNIMLRETQMCAGGENQVNPCLMDEGGPLGATANYNGPRFVQFGIDSFGPRCDNQTNLPAVFTRVASYMDWILENIKP